MNETRSPLTQENPLVLIFAGTAVVGLLIAKAGDLARAALDWLTTHDVLTRTEVLVTIPNTNGAGLDLARLAIAASVLVLVALAISAAVRRRRSTGETRPRPTR